MPKVSNARIRFGPFEADLRGGELFKGKMRLPLQEKPFQLLRVLLENAENLVTREELFSRVWPDIYVQRDLCLNTAIRKLRVALGDVARKPKFIETVGSRGYRLLVGAKVPADMGERQPQSASKSRLAVLPFENLNGTDLEYFSEGITEQLIRQLGHLHPDLGVIAPASVMKYRNDNKDVREICRELGADYALAGSMMRDAGSLRVTARLLRASDASTIWAETFSQKQVDIFLIQDAILQQMARSILRLQEVVTVLRPPMSTSPATYENYLKACYFAHKWEERAAQKAEQLFLQVIEEDRGFAPGYSGLARLYSGMAQLCVAQPGALYQRVNELAGKALELSDGTVAAAEALVALAMKQMYFDTDWAGAEASCRRALALNNSMAPAYKIYAQLFSVLGKHQEANSYILRAREFAPLSPGINTVAARQYYFARQYEQAAKACQIALELDSAFPVSQITMSWIHSALNQPQQAVADARSAVPAGGAIARANLAILLPTVGAREEAGEILAQLLGARDKVYFCAYWIALIYLALGESTKALAWLETSFVEHCGWRTLCGIDPRLDGLNGVPHYEALIKRLKRPAITHAISAE